MDKPLTVAERLAKLKRSIEDSVCNWCDEPILSFEDPISEREYLISGQCQHCQDKIFTKDPFVEDADEV